MTQKGGPVAVTAEVRAFVVYEVPIECEASAISGPEHGGPAVTETQRQRERRLECWAGCKAADLNAEQLIAARLCGYEPSPDGYMVGRDPRGMTQVELRGMGHEPLRPMAAIRAKCLDCCAEVPGVPDSARSLSAGRGPQFIRLASDYVTYCRFHLLDPLRCFRLYTSKFFLLSLSLFPKRIKFGPELALARDLDG
jgi:hypothetical protein